MSTRFQILWTLVITLVSGSCFLLGQYWLSYGLLGLSAVLFLYLLISGQIKPFAMYDFSGNEIPWPWNLVWLMVAIIFAILMTLYY